MRKISYPLLLLSIAISLFAFTNCKEIQGIISIPNPNEKSNLPTVGPSGMTISLPDGGYRQIVVSGNRDTLQLIADSLGIQNTKGCSCDNDIILWNIPDNLNIETAIGTVRRNSGKGVKGDVNIEIVLSTNSEIKLIKQDDFQATISLNNGEPVIAIIDTGLEIQTLIDEGNFKLLQTDKYNNAICIDGTTINGSYGWNFINENADLSDFTKHGTFVTKNILKKLSDLDTDQFQILPLKVFNNEGRGNYWDIVCAFSYINKIMKMEKAAGNNLDIAIINASFGATLAETSFNFSEDFLVLKDYIDMLSEKSIVVASAGNEVKNNDTIPHFPSSYNSSLTFNTASVAPSNNIVSVAGYEGSYGSLLLATTEIDSIGSNYGEQSVDLAAPWSYVLNDNVETRAGAGAIQYRVQGTSYGASYLSANLLKFGLQRPDTRGQYLLYSFLYESNIVKRSSSDLLVKDFKYVE